MRGVTYEILDLYRFLVTELVFLDDYLLNYMSLICHRDKIQKFKNLQILIREKVKKTKIFVKQSFFNEFR